jgi:glutathione S-transferase
MHAGFADLRREMPMNIVARTPREPSPAVARDIERILAIWDDCRSLHAERGPFLFGAFSIADAMFAPVVTRFVTYGVPVAGAARAYMNAILDLPAMRRWAADAADEVRAA